MITLEAKDHRQSLAERERFITEIQNRRPVQSVYMQTCNRVEIYSGHGQVPPEIVRHLFRVAAGLESRLIGETAILGQIKQAYQQAADLYPLPKQLHCLFQNALKAGKRVRTETRLSRGAVGHSQAALNLIRNTAGDLSKLHITMLGVNRLNRSIVKYLADQACRTIFLSTRSFAKALSLGQELGCRAFPLAELSRHLLHTDVLISATSAPHAIVKYADVPQDRDLVIVDLAVPRDVEARIGVLPRVRLFNLEDVETFALSELQLRTREIAAAERIVDQEVEAFLYAQTQKEN